MDQQRFDTLTRLLAGRLPRRGLGPLAGGLLGLMGTEQIKARRKAVHRPHKAHDHQAPHPEHGVQSHHGGSASSRRRHDTPVHAAKAKGKCVTAGGSCKKAKKGKKAKKCCAGLTCDAQTHVCQNVNSTPPPPDTCQSCVATCSTCNLDGTGCRNSCDTDACAAIKRSCGATGAHSAHQALASYLTELGLSAQAGTRGTVTREDGVTNEGVLETDFTGSGQRAVLRTVADQHGVAMSAAVLLHADGSVDYGIYVNDAGEVQRLNPSDLDTSDTANRAVGRDDSATSCLYCTKACNWIGANSICFYAGNICVAKIRAGGVPGVALALAACGITAATICQEGGAATCDAFCSGICHPPLCPGGDESNCLGTCCDASRCEHCLGGQCTGCEAGAFCAHKTGGPRAPINTYTCEVCPTCTGTCEVLTLNEQVAPGTSGCGSLTCDGPCHEGPNYHCRDGHCRCEATTCLATGRVCGTMDDGCGGQVDCGTCPIGKTCTAAGTCRDLGPCEEPGHTCRWVGTFEQKHVFHGTNSFIPGTTEASDEVTYVVRPDQTMQVTSSQRYHSHADDPTICNHLINDAMWSLEGHSEEAASGGAVSCGRPGGSGFCSFGVASGGRAVTVQNCTTFTSGANAGCGTDGCRDLTVEGLPGIAPVNLGLATSDTLTGSNTFQQSYCSNASCGPHTYEQSWNFTYVQVD